MNKRWGIALGSCAMFVTLTAAAATMQDQDGWINRRASGMIIHRIEQRLRITRTQRLQIKSILQAEQPKIQALAVRVQQENNQLTSKPAFDEDYVRAFARQHAATTEDILVEREKVRIEILEVLTPDQRHKLQQMRQSMRSHFTERISSLTDQI